MRNALFVILYRLVMLALTVAACAALTRRLGPALAILAWALLMAVVCGTVALLMHRAPPGKITLANRLAGLVLPWGYALGRGKLFPIVLTSWTVWLLLGSVAAWLASTCYDPRPIAPDGQPHITPWLILLLLAWLVDAIAFSYLLRTLTTRLTLRSRAALTMFVLLAILLAVIAGSAGLWFLGHPQFAVLLAGGPPLFLGGSYALFLLTLLITKPRWN